MTTKRVTRPKRKPAHRKPQARGNATRERLLEAALDQFVKRGFHGTSMRHIAAAAGLAVGGIYNHFDSKEAVFAAVLDANHPYRLVLELIQSVTATSLEAFVRETAARIWADVRGRQQIVLALMTIEMVEFHGVHVQAMADNAVPGVLAIVQRLQQAEENRPLPAPVIMRAFVSQMVGNLLIDSVLSQSALFQAMPYDWLGMSVDIFLHGVLK